jgi:hypothetical protein
MIIWICLDGLRSVLSHQLLTQNETQSKTNTFVEKESDDDKTGSKNKTFCETSDVV